MGHPCLTVTTRSSRHDAICRRSAPAAANPFVSETDMTASARMAVVAKTMDVNAASIGLKPCLCSAPGMVAEDC